MENSVASVMPALWTTIGSPKVEKPIRGPEKGPEGENEEVEEEPEIEVVNETEAHPVVATSSLLSRHREVRRVNGMVSNGHLNEEGTFIPTHYSLRTKGTIPDVFERDLHPVVERDPLDIKAEEWANKSVDGLLRGFFFMAMFGYYFTVKFCNRAGQAFPGFDPLCNLVSFVRWCFVTVPCFALLSVTVAIGNVWALGGWIVSNFFRIIVFLIAVSVICNLCLAIAGYRGPQMNSHPGTRPIKTMKNDPRVVCSLAPPGNHGHGEGKCQADPTGSIGGTGPRGLTNEELMERRLNEMVQKALRDASRKQFEAEAKEHVTHPVPDIIIPDGKKMFVTGTVRGPKITTDDVEREL
jgi:hypothetical protein